MRWMHCPEIHFSQFPSLLIAIPSKAHLVTSFLTALFLLALLAVPASANANQFALTPGDHLRTVKSQRTERSYIVHVPPRFDPKKPIAVILAFHGGGGNAEQFSNYCGLNKKSDEVGCLIVYPNGSGRTSRLLTFNAGNCCGYAMTNDIDDVEFTRQILLDLAKVSNVDKRRIFATGISNGAMMSYRLASELSDQIAAIAPIAGPMGTEKCTPASPVSVIHFHGTADENAPFTGGRGKGVSGTDFYSVDHSIQAWVKSNQCDPKPKEKKFPDKANDNMTASSKLFRNEKNGAEVELVTIEGGGHTWPGQDARLRMLGKSTQDISANDLMWEFFLKHPKP